MKLKKAIGVLLSLLIGCNVPVIAAPQNQQATETITEVSFRQSCLCGPNDFFDITLKADEPSTAGYFLQLRRWIETQPFSEMKERYFSSGNSECQRSYSIIRSGQKKVITSDCMNEPPELWALGTVMIKVADDIKKEQLRRHKEKQGVRGVVENYKQAPLVTGEYVPPLMISFEPEPYQWGVEGGGTVVNNDGTFHLHLLPGFYRVVLTFPDMTNVRRQLVTVEAEKFLILTVDAKKPAPQNKE